MSVSTIARTFHQRHDCLVKLFFSYAYKKQLEYFIEEFDKLRRRTDGVYKSTMPQIQIETVATKTTEILDKIRFVDPDMLQAQLFVDAHGGVVAHPALVTSTTPCLLTTMRRCTDG